MKIASDVYDKLMIALSTKDDEATLCLGKIGIVNPGDIEEKQDEPAIFMRIAGKANVVFLERGE